MKFTLLLFALCGTAFAIDCDSLVVDQSGVLNTSAITAAASAVQNLGADVRIRIYDSLSGSTLDAMERDAERACLSWQSPDGHRKNNLIVLSVAIKNHKSGLYFGSQWKSSLDSMWPRIQSQFMNPRFRERNFTGGFVAGLNEIGRVVSTPVAAAAAPAVIINQPASEPTNWGEVWSIILLLFLVGCIGLLIAVIVRRKRNRDERSGTQQRAIMAQADVVHRLAKLNDAFEPFSILTVDKDRVATVRKQIDECSETYSNLKQSSLADPNTPGLTVEQYAAIAEKYEEIVVDLKAIYIQVNPLKAAPKPKPIRTETGRFTSSKVNHSSEPKKQKPVERPIEEDRRGYYVPSTPAPSINVFAPVTEINEERHEHHHRSSWSESSDSPSSSSGGSSDWGSSSGSSSSSDSGGSSDWGSSSSSDSSSSSSDSGGGGGSSDW